MKTIWLPLEPGTFTHEQAVAQFGQKPDGMWAHPTKRLPTIGQLRRAWEKGIKFKNERYWSSSVHPFHSYYAYYFNGRDGGIGYVFRDIYDSSVRCVAAR